MIRIIGIPNEQASDAIDALRRTRDCIGVAWNEIDQQIKDGLDNSKRDLLNTRTKLQRISSLLDICYESFREL